MALNEQFQVVVLIDKLPPSWKDFKKISRHKSMKFFLKSLITRLRIEEEAKKQDQKEEVFVISSNNTKKSTNASLKPNAKNFKNQNRKANQKRNNQPQNKQQNTLPKEWYSTVLMLQLWQIRPYDTKVSEHAKSCTAF